MAARTLATNVIGERIDVSNVTEVVEPKGLKTTRTVAFEIILARTIVDANMVRV